MDAGDERRLASCLCSLSSSPPTLSSLPPSPIDVHAPPSSPPSTQPAIPSSLSASRAFSATVIAQHFLSAPPNALFCFSAFSFFPLPIVFHLCLVHGHRCETVQAAQEGPRPCSVRSSLSHLSPPPKHNLGLRLTRVILFIYSRPAWTGPRASPTFSPAPANARLPNGNQQPPSGAFPPLANGARANTSIPDPSHARILAQISGLTVRNIHCNDLTFACPPSL